MHSTHIKPTPGRVVWYRGADNLIRAALIAAVNSDFNVNLDVSPLHAADIDCGFKERVTHADPEQEPSCYPSWHWMPYQIDQAKKLEPAEVVKGSQGDTLLTTAGKVGGNIGGIPGTLHPAAETELRSQALSSALTFGGTNGSPEAVLKAAATYFAFLKDGTMPPAQDE